MIILEGCDNTGKTTLKNKLMGSIPSLVAGPKLAGPPTDKEQFLDLIWSILGKPVKDTHNLIFDRFYFSELVYGPILRKSVMLTESQMSAVNNLLTFHQPMIIYCRQDATQILESFGERDQLEGVKERVEAIVGAYEEVFKSFVKANCSFIRYNYKNQRAMERVTTDVSAYIRRGGYKA